MMDDVMRYDYEVLPKLQKLRDVACRNSIKKGQLLGKASFFSLWVRIQYLKVSLLFVNNVSSLVPEECP